MPSLHVLPLTSLQHLDPEQLGYTEGGRADWQAVNSKALAHASAITSSQVSTPRTVLLLMFPNCCGLSLTIPLAGVALYGMLSPAPAAKGMDILRSQKCSNRVCTEREI
jgi:hypothetical protein